MSVYPPPTQSTQTIFNPFNYTGLDDSLTIRQANNTYLLKTGTDTAVGPLTCKNFLQATIFKATQGTYPTCAFTNSTDTTTGLYFGTTSTCAIGCGGSTKMTFGSTSNTSFNPITSVDGSVALASYNFSSSTNTGLYYTTGIMNVGINGVQRFSFENGGMKYYNSVSGYTPSLLNYYEESTKNLTWVWGSVNSGAIPVKFIRFGNACIAQITSDVVVGTPSAAQQFCTSNAMDARFRPSNPIYFSWFGYDNQTSSFVNWRRLVKTTGEIEVYRYQGAVTNGLSAYAYSFSWSIY